MTFLNPLVLLGLITASIPVILHLLNLRKLRTIEFSTLTFLKELQRTQIRRLKLRQILLLITRTALIIFIVLAFARPALRGSFLGNLGTTAHSSVVYILDDSFTMGATDEYGERFKQAKEIADSLIRLLNEGDEAFLIKLSDLPRATLDHPTHDFTGLHILIGEARLTAVRRSIIDALPVAATLLRQSSNANKEVYIISDMQRTLFTASKKPGEQTTVPAFDRQTNIFLIPIGSGDIGNTGCDSLSLTTTILEKGKPASLYTLVGNFTKAPVQNLVVSAYLEGVKVSQRSISIEPWNMMPTDLLVTAKHAGWTQGYVETESDPIDTDNRRYFTMNIPEDVHLALVSDSPANTQFLKLALHAGSQEAGKPLFDIQELSAEKFSLLNLKNVDVLILTDLTGIVKNDVSRIKNFVERGGGLVLFPGNNLQTEKMNSSLLTTLNIPPITGMVSSPGDKEIFSFGKVDLNHPLFSTIFESESAIRKNRTQTIESPRIVRYIKHQAGKQSHTIIELGDGSPFLSEYTIAAGKVLFFSVAPTLRWSDFPLKGIFAPLIYRAGLYSLPHQEENISFTAGDEPIITLNTPAALSGGKQFTLTGPDGLDEAIQPSAQPAHGDGIAVATMFHLNRTDLPGIYQIKNGSSLLLMFAVNTDPLESDTRLIKPDKLTTITDSVLKNSDRMHILLRGTAMHSVILQTRYGVELWRYCIVLAILLALFEMILARDSRKGTAQQ
jgi:hypothetical protein